MADKRTALLDAGEAVLAERGLAGTTVDEVTTRAGVAKGTFYLYFASKDALVGGVKERLWRGMLQKVVDGLGRLRSGADYWATHDRVVEAIVDFDLEHAWWHKLVAPGWGVTTPEDVAVDEEFIEVVAAGIRYGVELGLVACEDPTLTARLLFHAVSGATHTLLQSGDGFDRDHYVGQLQEFVRRVLLPRPPSG